MEQTYKDETRWLARVLAILFIVLSIRALVVLVQHISEDRATISRVAISLTGLMLLIWLAYRLMMCSSLWNMFSWMPYTPPIFLYFRCQYFRINTHIRAGLIGGVILLILAAPLPLIFHYYKETWFWGLIKQIVGIILWPLLRFFDMLNTSRWPVEFCSFLLYFFVLGLILGSSISCVTERLIDNRKHLSPKDLNNGSPGCSAAEPGD